MSLTGVNNFRAQAQEMQQSCESFNNVEIQSTGDLINILSKMSEQLEQQSKELKSLKDRVAELSAEQKDTNDLLLEKTIINH